MKIALDMDSVLCDWNEPFAQLLSALTGRTFERGIGWPAVWDWPAAAGFTKDDLARAWTFLRENPDWWFYLPPTPDASRLIEDGRLARLVNDHDVLVVTNRMPLAKRATQLWLQRWCDVELPTVLMHAGDKGPLFDALDVEVAVDDKPSNLTTARTTPRLYLIDTVANQHVDDLRLERGTLIDFVDELYPAASAALSENPYDLA